MSSRFSRPAFAVASDRAFTKLNNVALAIHRGFWLGMLDRASLLEAGDIAYGTWDRFLDEDYNRSGLADWERRAVTEHFPGSGRVLVPFAGGGREVIALANLGYDVVGFDSSRDLIEVATGLVPQHAKSVSIEHAEVDVIPPLEGEFDAVLLGWGGYTHIQGRSARVDFLLSVKAVLKPDAPLLISFLLRDSGDRRFALTSRVATSLRRLRRSEETVEPGDVVAGTFDHYFTWPEVDEELSEAGFEIVKSQSTPYAHALCRAI
ncbi:MAG: class I SAM-dependent methyltransferase [Acidimicrobiales bacterium]